MPRPLCTCTISATVKCRVMVKPDFPHAARYARWARNIDDLSRSAVLGQDPSCSLYGDSGVSLECKEVQVS